MTARDIFTDRAAGYGRMTWHDAYARGLVGAMELPRGATVLDAGAGTGFASRAAARAVGPVGRVIATDITEAMLARLDTDAGPDAAPIEKVLADATDLALPDCSVDAVVCSAALLYMPADRALAEWRRVLRPGGLVGFSTMAAGQPPAAGLFRALVGELGIRLADPSEALGSPLTSRAALERAGFRDVRVRPATVSFSDDDLAGAWDAHERGAREDLAGLSSAALSRLRGTYETALRDLPGRHTARVLHATGRR